MPTKTSTQREAQRLATFLSLEPSKIENFRRDNPRFAPATWWDYGPAGLSAENRMNWQITQDFLRKVWEEGFEPDLKELVRLLLYVFDPNGRKSADGVSPFGAFFEPDQPGTAVTPADTIIEIRSEHPLVASLSELDQDWGFHIGVRYLAEHSWAAKFCKECKRPFVADIPPRKYCFEKGADGMRCSERVIARDHLKWWHAKGDKKRKAAKKKLRADRRQ